MASVDPYIMTQFAYATMLPVLVSILLAQLKKKSDFFMKLGFWPQQIICGISFGLVAIVGTEWGIYTNDATMNVRDAAPIVAALYFGGPAGIIAGVMGGVERWFAALWGRGMFTRLACSVATVAAGVYGAILRRYMFEDEEPSWPLAASIGAVVEVLHLLLIFMTNLDQSARAFLVVKACTFPMIGCNALSVGLSGAVLYLLKGMGQKKRTEAPHVSHIVQLGMLLAVVVGFAATLAFVAALQTSLITANTEYTLSLSLDDLNDDIEDASDKNLISLAKRVAREVPSVDDASEEQLVSLCDSLNLTDINLVDEHGIIVMSSDSSYIGFDMSSGEQAAEFLTLLPGGGARQVVQSYQPITKDETIWRKYAGISIDGGFLQVGYDSQRFAEELTDQVRSAVANRHVGTDGMLVVLTERDVLVGTRSDLHIDFKDVQRLSAGMEAAGENAVFEVKVQGISYFAMYRSTEGMRVMSMIPTAEAEMERDVSVLITSFMEVIAFAAIFIAIYVLIERVVVSSILRVNSRLSEITSGDLTVKVDVRDSAEFASLSDDINATVSALRESIAAETARIERDLATAKAIQESALPRTFPPFPDIKAFDIFASMNPAREVGGDFYDFFLIDRNTLCFLVADVSGKGIPASLFMMAAKAELANYIKSGMKLAEAVQSANWNLCQGNDAGMFVTVWAATLDYNTGELTYVNAGHNPPVLRHEGQWEWLKQRGGLFLGTFETAKYRSFTTTLVPGDELLLYTDGVNEAFSTEGEEYGYDRMEEFLAKHKNLHSRMMVDMLRADVRHWAKGAEQSDDITILCLEFGTPPEVSGTTKVPASIDGLQTLRRQLHYEFSQIQCPGEIQRQIDLAVEELFTNICHYGYAGQDEPGDVELSYLYDNNPRALTISITDWSEPFDPLSYEDAEGMGSLGISIALGSVDDIAYVRDGDRNVVAFRKTW